MSTFSVSKWRGLGLCKAHHLNITGTESCIIFYAIVLHACDLLPVVDRSLRCLLDGEMEHSAGLRQETDLLKKKLAELEERHTAKVQALAR